jgi:hypothetical protein
VVLAALSACSNATTSTTAPASATTPSAQPELVQSLPAPALQAVTTAPSRSEAHAARVAWYLAIREYDVSLIKDGPTELGYADQLCLDLRGDDSRAMAERDAAKLFNVEADKAKQIVEITKSKLCAHL